MPNRSLIWAAICFGLLISNNPVFADKVVLKIGKARITKEAQKLVTSYAITLDAVKKVRKGKPISGEPVTEKISPSAGSVFLIVECTLEGKGKDVPYDYEKDFLLKDGGGNKTVGFINTGEWYSGGVKGKFIKVKIMKFKLLYKIPEKIREPLKIIYGGKEYPVTVI